MIVLIIVIVVKVDSLMIVLSGLHLASVAFLPEGEVEVVAFDADPILGGIRRGREVGVWVFKEGGFTVLCHFLFYYFEYIESWESNRKNRVFAYLRKR